VTSVAALLAKSPEDASVTSLEVWHNRQRRHSQLGMLSPIQFEAQGQHS